MHEEFMIIAIVALALGYKLARVALQQRGTLNERQRQEEETRLVQDIHRELERIEQRVEALETILLETETRRQAATARD